MTYDAVVTTNEGKHTYQNIEAKNEQHLINKIAKDLKTEIVEIEIKKTFGEGVWKKMKIKNGQNLYIVTNASYQEPELITADENKAIDYIDRQMEEIYGFGKEAITEVRENYGLEGFYLLDCVPLEE